MLDQFATVHGHVRPAHRRGEATAGRRHRREPEVLQEPARPTVERVRHHEGPPLVEGAEAGAHVIDVHAGMLAAIDAPDKRFCDITVTPRPGRRPVR